jgi:hypothetical protein
VEGKYQGRGTLYYENGGELEVDWLDNRPHGVGTFTPKTHLPIPVSYHCGKKVDKLESVV